MRSAVTILLSLLLVTFVPSCKKDNTTTEDLLSGNYKGRLNWSTLDRRYGIDSDFTFTDQKLAKLTLNTDAPIFSKVFELPYDNVVLGDRETTYVFSVSADVGYSLSLSITVPEQGDIYSDFFYINLPRK